MEKLLAFFEIPATDFSRAVKFYEAVLGLKFTVEECDEEKMAFFPAAENEVSGAISWAKKGFNPSGDGVLIHFNVGDVQETLVLAERNGGKIVRPKTKIECEGMGYFGLFSDSEGNTIGLYSDK